MGASWGHAAAGNFALEDAFTNDVLAVIVMAGATRQHREGQDAAAQALDGGNDSGERQVFSGANVIAERAGRSHN